MVEQASGLKKRIKTLDAALDANARARYLTLTPDEVKALVVDHKWMAALGAAWLTLALLLGILLSLVAGAMPAIREYGLSFLWRSEWDPVGDQYGGLVMIYGTLMTSLIALLIAVPVSFGIALFLTEICPAWLRRPLGTAVELLAGVPSIIYGMWGLFVFAPLFGEHVQPWILENLGELNLANLLRTVLLEQLLDFVGLRVGFCFEEIFQLFHRYPYDPSALDRLCAHFIENGPKKGAKNLAKLSLVIIPGSQGFEASTRSIIGVFVRRGLQAVRPSCTP